MTRAGNKIALGLIKKQKEPCNLHDGKPIFLPTLNKTVCNQCGKEFK